ncbi:hypothetical protein PCANC_17917 [Puccinia coronata f. sp. avenae]|uniref:Uncharacterized protein n=1 Tax=Puccinia coronata f. sp. avenae TaxID=200324 RepID=A0A2N5UDT9_9BASI|nr:hypothetical protein PCANC_17917 [Puccinia coronata f. sp. avenae]PLW44712.1 hypothetical protein PCASD_05896 [Puccinia coronata f. sp. avenae]
MADLVEKCYSTRQASGAHVGGKLSKGKETTHVGGQLSEDKDVTSPNGKLSKE